VLFPHLLRRLLKGAYFAHKYPSLVSTSICGPHPSRSPSRRLCMVLDYTSINLHRIPHRPIFFRSLTPRFASLQLIPSHLTCISLISFFASFLSESIDRAHSSIRSTELSHSLAALCFHHLTSQYYYYIRGSVPDCNQSENNFLVDMSDDTNGAQTRCMMGLRKYMHCSNLDRLYSSTLVIRMGDCLWQV